MLNLKEWFDPVFKILTILVIPAFLWINFSINELKTQVELIQQQIQLRSYTRDSQITLILKLIQDHEDRIRQLERTGHNSEGPRLS